MLIHKRSLWIIVASLAALVFTIRSAAQQKINKVDLERARAVLHHVKELIAKNYYDPTFHGYDLDARFQKADQKLTDVNSFEMGMNVVGWAVQGLSDSSTTFFPPFRNVVVYNGWRMEMIGKDCVILAVEPKSDAWKGGLRPGDVVHKVEDYEPSRTNFAQIAYIFNVLAPLAQYHFVVASPGQPSHSLTTRSRLVNIPLTNMPGATTRQELNRIAVGNGDLYKTRAVEVNEKLMIWKLPAFRIPESEIKREAAAAKRHETLILDLRENSGGSEDQLLWMIGSFFDHDIKAGEKIERDKTEPLNAPSFGKESFTGKLIVLVNNASTSAAEIFARVVQLEKRGVVMGDQTAGAVGSSQFFPDTPGLMYHLQITTARLKMSDGADLEGKGVTPDTLKLPTPADLAEGRDPVLSAAAQLAGAQLSPEEAGKMFPVVWPTY